jgi:CTP-dependent riboflavin kinase
MIGTWGWSESPGSWKKLAPTSINEATAKCDNLVILEGDVGSGVGEGNIFVNLLDVCNIDAVTSKAGFVL